MPDQLGKSITNTRKLAVFADLEDRSRGNWLWNGRDFGFEMEAAMQDDVLVGHWRADA